MADDEQRQDQELQDLRKQVTSNRDVNDKAHADISKGAEANYHRLAAKIDELKDGVSSLKGDSKGGKWVVNVIRVVAVAALGVAGWLAARGETRLDDMDRRQTSDASRGFQIADELRSDVDKNEAGIDELQRRIDESNRPGPGKE